MCKDEIYTNTWKRKSINLSLPVTVKEYLDEIAMTASYNNALNMLAEDGHCVSYELDEVGDKFMKENFIYKRWK